MEPSWCGRVGGLVVKAADHEKLGFGGATVSDLNVLPAGDVHTWAEVEGEITGCTNKLATLLIQFSSP
jgi:hypothetical protein